MKKNRWNLKMTRRQVLRAGMISGAGMMLPWQFRSSKAYADTRVLSDPVQQPKFVNTVPNALDPGFIYNADSNGLYTIGVGPTVQRTGLVNPSGHMLRTRLFGYGQDGVYTWPGKTFEVWSEDSNTEVKWENNLFRQRHFLPVDTSVHWCYSLPDYQQFTINKDGVPIITHLHGGNSNFQFDGNPEFFYSPGGAILGPQWENAGYFSVPVFQYNNNVPAGNLWYHDHALGITRLNVYAGLAGFYFVRDDEDPGANFNGTYDRNLPKFPYEVALAIQDRMFLSSGGLFYPSRPSDLYWDEFIREEGLNTGLVPKPSALAEFFGDHMLVNGMIWPKMDVDRTTYRLRLLNGCDSRFMVLQFVVVDADVTDPSAGTPLDFTVIGSDQGLGAPTITDTLVFEPGGRYDILIDFSVPALEGQRVIMKNIGGDAPFGGAFSEELDPEEDFFPNRQTDRIMAFDVTGPLVDNGEIDLDGLNPYTVSNGGPTRKVALFEGRDEYGRLQPLLGTVANDLSSATAYTWFQDTTETPNVNTTETWEVYNFTGDAHPIHLHLVNFQILSRNEITFDEDEDNPQQIEQHNGTYGTVPAISDILVGSDVTLGPGDGYVENAPKDMVTALPEQVTRIRARFNKEGRYVWHCHILSHEDHEMMRVLQVVPAPA